MKIKTPILTFSAILVIFVAVAFSSCKNETTEGSSADAVAEAPVPKKQLRHVVLFKFIESATEEDIALVEKAFTALPAKIPEIRDFEWGTNNSPEGLDKGYSHCFLLTFDSEADRAVYLPHPDHKALGDVLSPYIEDVLVVDYWVAEE
jgi:hypothetical protein